MPDRETLSSKEGHRVRDYPRIVVPPPGPKAQAVVRRDEEWTAPCYIKEYPLVVSRGLGPMVEDVDGNRFLDFMAGIAVCSTGYSHPRVVAAGQDAAELLKNLVLGAFQRGLLLLGAGKSTLRLAPPLVVDEQDVDTALAIIDGLLSELD